jgi:hypothetical protein
VSGKNTPRSVKRLRMLFVKMIQDHQSGKTPLKPAMLVKVADRIGVIDGFFPKECLALERVREYGPRSCKTAPEEPDEDDMVRQLREDILKRRGDANPNS